MKKLLCLILALSALLCLASCSSDENGSTSASKGHDSDADESRGSYATTRDDDTMLYHSHEPSSGESTSYYDDTLSLEDWEFYTPTVALKDAKVGDYISFGSYEQDNDTSNGKEAIEWLVLDIQDGKALVISKYALDCQQYNTNFISVTWETCSLRTWLNEDFLNNAFSSSEIACIPTVTVSAGANPDYDTDAGNDTQDKVFLLSTTEAEKYFSSNSERECTATSYAIAQGAWISNYSGYEGNCRWWLRSPGDSQVDAAYVYFFGFVDDYGDLVSSDYLVVRPALWIELDS